MMATLFKVKNRKRLLLILILKKGEVMNNSRLERLLQDKEAENKRHKERIEYLNTQIAREREIVSQDKKRTAEQNKREREQEERVRQQNDNNALKRLNAQLSTVLEMEI